MGIRNIGLPLAALAVAAVVVSGCAREPEGAAAETPEPAEIIVEPAELRLAAGTEGELAAQANDAAGQPIGGASIRFSVADPGVLRVSQRGRVTSLGPAAKTSVMVASGRSSRRVLVEVHPGAPQRIEKLAGDGQAVVAGQAPGEPLALRVLDLAGNPVGGVALALDSEDGQALAPEAETGPDGRASFQIAAIEAAGTLRLRVRERETGAPSEIFQVEIGAGPPAAVEVACAAPTTGPDDAQHLELHLLVRDGYGNAVPAAALRARLGADAATGQEFTTDAGGSARLEFSWPKRSRAPVLEVLAGETRLARVTLEPKPAGCPDPGSPAP